LKKIHYIYEEGDHKWAAIARDPNKRNYLIDTNEYLVIDGDEMLLTDPGGMEIFPAVFSAISTDFDPHDITALFASHQDPDIISSLALWLDFNPDLKCYLSWLWSTFVPHFGGNDETFISLPDEGKEISFGNGKLEFMPAHFLHSAGNFHLYDPMAKILFSGDMGAAMLPPTMNDLYVTNFDQHIKYAEKFHQRWMGSASARDSWCRRAAEKKIDMLCPQHGAIYQGDDVERFINWFSELKIGVLGG